MENPASWGELEKAIEEAIQEHADQLADLMMGLSVVKTIANKLRDKGLVKDSDKSNTGG